MIGKLASRCAPRLLWRYRVRSRHIDPDEPEAALLPELTSRRKLSIDVGAAEGKYTALLVPLSRHVVAFEPVSAFADRLRAMFRDTNPVTVLSVALSDAAGAAKLRVPQGAYWRATVETANRLAYTPDAQDVTVPMARLDEYSFHRVGFIKIDVEGHEAAVLKGAEATIARERPNVLIEVEEQHRTGALESVFGFFKAHDYRGHFMHKGQLVPAGLFEPSHHQNVANLDATGKRTGLYINNFIFRPRERL